MLSRQNHEEHSDHCCGACYKRSSRLTQIYTDLLEVIDRLTFAANKQTNKSAHRAVIRLVLSICCLLVVMRFGRRFFSVPLKLVTIKYETHNLVELNKKPLVPLLAAGWFHTALRLRGRPEKKKATLCCNVDVCHACTGSPVITANQNQRELSGWGWRGGISFSLFFVLFFRSF